MKISGLTVCVNYSHLLAKSLGTWARTLDSLVVVSDFKDEATRNLLTKYEEMTTIQVCHTDSFYLDGAVFNKARAMCEAIEVFDWLSGDWNLIFDADIVPEEGWRNIVNEHRPTPGNLYGAKRYLEDGRCVVENELAGYFQLFHSSDRNVQRKPLLETNWRHAGGYDSEFHLRWPEHLKIFLPIHLTHQGDPGKNWWGIGNEEMMDAMVIERLKTNRLAECEKIK